MSIEAYLKALVREALGEAFEDRQLRAGGTSPEVVGYLTAAAAASLASVSKGTVRAWLRTGKLKAYGTGRVVRIKREELEELLAHGSLRKDLPTVEGRAESIVMELTRKGAATRGG